MLAAVSPVLRLARKGFKRPVKLLVVNSKLHESFLAMCMNFHGLFDSLPLFEGAVNLVLAARRVSLTRSAARIAARKLDRAPGCGVGCVVARRQPRSVSKG